MPEIIPEPISEKPIKKIIKMSAAIPEKSDNRYFYLIISIGIIIVLSLGALTWRIVNLEKIVEKNRKTITGQELPSLIDAALNNEGARNLILQKINDLIANGVIKLNPNQASPFTAGTPTPEATSPAQPINP